MIADIIREHGDDLQRQRFAAGRLPEAELRDLVRSVLFRPLDDFERFKRLEPHHARHTDGCRGAADTVVSFKTDDDYRGSLTEDQWEIWQAIAAKAQTITGRLQSGDFVSTRVRAHLVECCSCGTGRTRLAAMVLVKFGTMTLSREYAL